MERNDSEEEFEKKVIKKQIPQKKKIISSKKSKHKIKYLKKIEIYVDIENIQSIIKTLNNFISELNSLSNIAKILTEKNLLFFSTLIENKDPKINLLLSKIYNSIISKEFLYKTLIPSINENDDYKIYIITELVNNISLLIKNLEDFHFSQEVFELKKRSLGLLNCLYNNCKNKFEEGDEKLEEIIELMNDLPQKYYSKIFNELSQSPEIFQILQSRDINILNLFEAKICQINNYFEQFEIFKKFVELNSDINLPKNNLSSDIETNYLIDFYEKYGSILVKFCVYHNYMFLDMEQEKESPNDEINIIDKQNEEKINVLFLKDKDDDNIPKDKYIKTNYISKTEKIENLLSNKRYKSSLATKQYNDLIRKVINFYLKTVIKDFENNPKIKAVKENLEYFRNSLKVESYFPLYLKNITSMVINDNFSQSFISNVMPGEANKIYFTSNNVNDSLIYIEFYLKDKTKDINFELNIYDSSLNKFKTLYKEERAEETVRIFMMPREYCIYELILDNIYSWFNNKIVNYRISFLNPVSDEENNYEDTEDYFFVDKEKYYYEAKKYFKNKTINLTNIPIVIKLNNLNIVKINDEISFKENTEDEEIVTRPYFNYILTKYIEKEKLENKQNIFVPIFSQNYNLTKNNKHIKKQFDECDDVKDQKFVENIGFIPDKEINKIKVIYKIFSLNEQILIHHKLIKYKKEKDNIKNSPDFILLININKDVLNTILFYKGEFRTKISFTNSNEIDFKDIDINNENELFDFIKNVNDNMKDLEIILSYEDNLEQKEKDLISNIKKYCGENNEPPLPFFKYKINDICNNAIKFICS